MKTEHAELLQRLEKFSFDSADASFPFSSRLAKENRWSIAYAHRVIEEYKRFAFLAVAAGHPVSPSEPVDQAWHLHLTYTESYWKQFCPEVLQMPLHHQPTKGGGAERNKFEDWYARTLQSYRFFFGEPPEEIWPSPARKAAEKNNFVRVDQEKNWVIPRLHFSRLQRNVGLVSLALIFAVGCQAIVADASNPLDLRGPDFLKWYFWLVVACFGVAGWLRWKLREPGTPSQEDFSNMDAYSIAFLNKGKVLAVNSAITSLIQQKVLKADTADKRLFHKGEPPDDLHPLEKTIYAAANGEKIGDVRMAAKPVVEAMMQQLQKHGLLVSDEQSSKVRWITTSLALLPVLVGIVKFFVGISRNRPVSFLVMACIVTAVVALIAFARRPHRSRRGDRVLRQLREKNASLENLKNYSTSLDPVYIAMAVGLFGMGALAGTPMNDLRKGLQPPPSAGSSSAGCGSSCGGGGGGCGGGCGGCGGGS